MKELWPGGPVYYGDPVGSDSPVLADFAGTGYSHGCDLGCGSGILTLLLLYACPSLRMLSIELREKAAEECEQNLRENHLSDRCQILSGDYRLLPLPEGEMDLVISNPPYFPAGAGPASPKGDRALMRQETATLSELCGCAARLLRTGGSFCLVHRTERLAEVLRRMSEAQLEPKRLRFFAFDRNTPPTLFFCEGIRGAAPRLTLQMPLLQQGDDGQETPEYRKLTHWEN